MNNPRILSLIKTPCGQAKYSELVLKKGVLAKLRLSWFIVIAILKDWNIKDKNQL